MSRFRIVHTHGGVLCHVVDSEGDQHGIDYRTRKGAENHLRNVRKLYGEKPLSVKDMIIAREMLRSHKHFAEFTIRTKENAAEVDEVRKHISKLSAAVRSGWMKFQK